MTNADTTPAKYWACTAPRWAPAYHSSGRTPPPSLVSTSHLDARGTAQRGRPARQASARRRGRLVAEAREAQRGAARSATGAGRADRRARGHAAARVDGRRPGPVARSVRAGRSAAIRACLASGLDRRADDRACLARRVAVPRAAVAVVRARCLLPA